MHYGSLPRRPAPKAAAPAPAEATAPQSDAEFDDEGRRLIKAPLTPANTRPAPTVAKPEPAGKPAPVQTWRDGPRAMAIPRPVPPTRPGPPPKQSLPRPSAAAAAPSPPPAPPRRPFSFRAAPPGYGVDIDGNIVPTNIDEIPY
jgi:hypothetical protein